MTATVLQFTGKGEPRFEQKPCAFVDDQNALRDARMMKEAKADSGNWQGVLLLAMLTVMDKGQRAKLETALDGMGGEKGEQALAFVRFANATPDYAGRVAHALTVMRVEVGL